MSKEIAIKAENVSKIYRLYDNVVDRVKESLNPFKKKYHKEFYALKDVNFEIYKGETVGIIGRNGAGKSTLLKIITGIISPSSGNIFINGRISAILELGAGFNPELTGEENIFFSGTIMGYTKIEIEEKMDDIISFADIGDFINQPVRIYSSGMYIRLAFAVAINVDPDILIIDEALSVGDMRFQQKCLRKIDEFKENGTVLFVSHDMGAITNLCYRALWFDNGAIRMEDNAKDVAQEYAIFMTYGLTDFEEKTNIKKQNSARDKDAQMKMEEEMIQSLRDDVKYIGEGGAKITGISLIDLNINEPTFTVKCGKELKLLLKVIVFEDVNSPIIGFIIKDRFGNNIFGANTFVMGKEINQLKNGDEIIVSFKFNWPMICNGVYTISPAFADGTQDDHIQHNWVYDALVVENIDKSNLQKIGCFLLFNDVDINFSVNKA